MKIPAELSPKTLIAVFFAAYLSHTSVNAGDSTPRTEIPADSAFVLAYNTMGLDAESQKARTGSMGLSSAVQKVPISEEWQRIFSAKHALDSGWLVTLDGIILDQPHWPRDVVAHNNPRSGQVLLDPVGGVLLFASITMTDDQADSKRTPAQPMSAEDFPQCLPRDRFVLGGDKKPKLSAIQAVLAAKGVTPLRTAQLFVTFTTMPNYRGRQRMAWIVVGYGTPITWEPDESGAGRRPGSVSLGPCEVVAVDDSTGRMIFQDSCPRNLLTRFRNHYLKTGADDPKNPESSDE